MLNRFWFYIVFLIVIHYITLHHRPKTCISKRISLCNLKKEYWHNKQLIDVSFPTLSALIILILFFNMHISQISFTCFPFNINCSYGLTSQLTVTEELSMVYIQKQRHNWRTSPDLWSAECRVSAEGTQGRTRKRHLNIEMPSPYIQWHNTLLEKILTAEQ